MVQFRVFQHLQQAHSALFRAADQHLRAHEGLTASQQAILFLLRSNGPLPITDIARMLHMGNSSITGLVNRMAGKNLVRRQTSDADGRVQLITLAPAGAAICEHALPLVSRLNEALLAPFDDRERNTIKAFLDHVRDHASDIVGVNPDVPNTAEHQKGQSS